MDYCDDDRHYIWTGRQKTDLVDSMQSDLPTDTMEHTAVYYTDKIAEYTAAAEAAARKLYADALAGTITYTQAWYSLPGPAPVVHTHQQGTGYTPNGAVMTRGGTVYVGQYRFLPAQDVATLKMRVDEEFLAHVESRQTARTSITHSDKTTETDLKQKMESARAQFDQSVGYRSNLEGRIAELRAQLANLEAAYTRACSAANEAARVKEQTETAFQTFMTTRESKMQSARIEVDAKDRLLAELREAATARWAKEDAEFNTLYQRKDAAVKAEGEEAKNIAERQARDRVAAAAQREFERRIEAEAQARMKDAEFERLVRERMSQMRGPA